MLLKIIIFKSSSTKSGSPFLKSWQQSQHLRPTPVSTYMCSRSWRFYISIWGLPRWRYWSRTHLPMQETQGTQVRSLGWEDPNIAAHSSIFAWRIPWTEEPGGLHSIALQRVRHNWSDLACTHISIWLLPNVFWSAWAQQVHTEVYIILLLFTFLSIIPCLMLTTLQLNFI